MSRLLLGRIALMALIASTVVPVATAEDGDTIRHQVGGQNLGKLEFLWFTAIKRVSSNQLICGGSLIGPRHVLTAAHCVLSSEGVEQSVYVDVGFYCIFHDNCGRSNSVVRVQDMDFLIGAAAAEEADVAVLTLDHAPEFCYLDSPDYNAAFSYAVPDLGGRYLKKLLRAKKKKRKTMTLVGAGKTVEISKDDTRRTRLSDYAQKIQVGIISAKKCRQKFGLLQATAGYVCSLPVANDLTFGPCSGDSGGPLVVSGKGGAFKGQDVVVAVHSFGRRVCGASRKKPDGHFSVLPATDLIRRLVCNDVVTNASPNLRFPDWCGDGGDDDDDDDGSDGDEKVKTKKPTQQPTKSPVEGPPDENDDDEKENTTGGDDGEELYLASNILKFWTLDRVSSIAIHPETFDRMAIANHRTLELWDVSALSQPAASDTVPMRLFDFVSGSANAVAYNHQGTLLALATTTNTAIWDAVDIFNGVQFTLQGENVVDAASTLCWNPPDTHVATGYVDGTVRLWDVGSATPGQPPTMTTLPQVHTGNINQLHFRPDARQLASASDDGFFITWDVATAQQVLRVRVHTTSFTAHTVKSVQFSPDGTQIATGSSDGAVGVWDAGTGELLRNFQGSALDGHGTTVRAVAWSPDGKLLASASADVSLKLWNVVAPEEEAPALLTLDEGHRLDILTLEWISASKGGKRYRLASGSADGSVVVWEIYSTTLPSSPPLEASFLFSAGGGAESVISVAFDPVDGQRLVTGSEGRGDPAVWLWGISNLLDDDDDEDTDDKEFSKVQLQSGHGFLAAFDSDGSRLATIHTTGGAVSVFENLDSESPLQTIIGHHSTSVGRDFSWSSDDTRVASTGDQPIRIWNVEAGNTSEEERLEASLFDESQVFAPSVSYFPRTNDPEQTGRLVTGHNGGRLTLWDGDMSDGSGRVLVQWKVHPSDRSSPNVNSVAFSPDGTKVASGSDDGAVRVWDGATGQHLWTLKGRLLQGHSSEVNQVAWSPDGSYLASASNDKTVKIWDGTKPTRCLLTLDGFHTERVRAVAWSPTGIHLASGAADWSAKLFKITSSNRR